MTQGLTAAAEFDSLRARQVTSFGSTIVFTSWVAANTTVPLLLERNPLAVRKFRGLRGSGEQAHVKSRLGLIKGLDRSTRSTSAKSSHHFSLEPHSADPPALLFARGYLAQIDCRHLPQLPLQRPVLHLLLHRETSVSKHRRAIGKGFSLLLFCDAFGRSRPLAPKQPRISATTRPMAGRSLSESAGSCCWKRPIVTLLCARRARTGRMAAR